MNNILIKMGRDWLRREVDKLAINQQEFFIRVFSHSNPDASIGEAVDLMDEDKIDSAMSLVQRTIDKNNIR